MFKMRKKCALAASLATAVLVASAPTYAFAESIPMEVNQTCLKDFDFRITRVSVANPEIADVVVVDNGMVLNIVSKAIGTTSLNVWTEDGMRQEFTITVAATDSRSAELIRQAIGLPGVSVDKVGVNIILRGTVENQYEKDLAEKVAQLYVAKDKEEVTFEKMEDSSVTTGTDAGSSIRRTTTNPARVINLLEMRNPDQINIAAMIIEINSDDAKNLGIKYGTNTDNPGVFYAGEGYNTAGNTYERSHYEWIPNSTNTGLERVEHPSEYTSYGYEREPGNGWFSKSWLFTHFSKINAQISALVKNGRARVISQPNITTMSGEDAVIHVGGKILVSSTNANGSTNTEEKPYGINLSLAKPVVDRQGNITTTLATTVSRLDWSNAVDGKPSMIERSAATVVNIPSGMTMVIGGLMNSEEGKTVTKVPILGNIPILGELFKYSETTHNKSELMVLITPRVVNEHSQVRMSEKMKELYDNERRAAEKDVHVDVNDPPEPSKEEKEKQEKEAQKAKANENKLIKVDAATSNDDDDSDWEKAKSATPAPVPAPQPEEVKPEPAPAPEPKQEELKPSQKEDSLTGKYLNQRVLPTADESELY